MQVLEAMAAQGTQPAPRDPAALGMPGAALPAMPVVPPRPPHVVPEEAELEVPPAAAAPAGEPACHTAAPAPAEAAAAGPAEAAAQAAAAEREQGNACFKRRQWELVGVLRRLGAARLFFAPLWHALLCCRGGPARQP